MCAQPDGFPQLEWVVELVAALAHRLEQVDDGCLESVQATQTPFCAAVAPHVQVRVVEIELPIADVAGVALELRLTSPITERRGTTRRAGATTPLLHDQERGCGFGWLARTATHRDEKSPRFLSVQRYDSPQNYLRLVHKTAE